MSWFVFMDEFPLLILNGEWTTIIDSNIRKSEIWEIMYWIIKELSEEIIDVLNVAKTLKIIDKLSINWNDIYLTYSDKLGKYFFYWKTIKWFIWPVFENEDFIWFDKFISIIDTQDGKKWLLVDIWWEKYYINEFTMVKTLYNDKNISILGK